MHSYDKTYIASLGFQDKDKKNPRHTLVVQYLIHHALDLAKRYMPTSALRPPRDAGQLRSIDEDHGVVSRQDWFKSYAEPSWKIMTHVEQPITKGAGQYKTCIGFLDLVLYADVEIGYDRDYETSVGDAFVMNVEVKVIEQDVSEIIRQIALYRTFVEATYWLVVTCYDVPAHDKALLMSAKIFHLRVTDERLNDYANILMIQNANTKQEEI